MADGEREAGLVTSPLGGFLRLMNRAFTPNDLSIMKKQAARGHPSFFFPLHSTNLRLFGSTP